MERITEIQARLAEINAELDTATGDDLTALETESRNLLAEKNTLESEIQARQQLRSEIAAGAGTPSPIAPNVPAANPSVEERAAAEFGKTNKMTIDLEQARATLISSGQLIKPTKVNPEIQDIPGSKVSSIIDLVHVENCEHMSSYDVAYVKADPAAAGDHVEGQAGSISELGTFDSISIKPKDVIVLGQVSKQAKKQTSLAYAEKVKSNAMLALRKKSAAIVTGALKAAELVKEIPGTAGKIDATTLRNHTLQYGDDESVLGGAYLFLNKKDLLAFGDVRGTNEKKALYTITQNPSNPNTGTISEGGLTVPYVLNSGLTALIDAAEGAGRTMFYGAPSCLHIAMFSNYTVKVSEDFAFDKLLDTIRGDIEMNADVVVPNGFISITA